MTKHVSVARDIAADPLVVWQAIADITRMGEWSTECHTCAWAEGHNGPVVGAVFDGHNRNSQAEWTTQGHLTECEPGVSFHFDAKIGDYTFARWGYDFEALDTGTRVTEFWEDLRTERDIAIGTKISGVDDRAEFNRQSMETTLERIAAAVEG